MVCGRRGDLDVDVVLEEKNYESLVYTRWDLDTLDVIQVQEMTEKLFEPKHQRGQLTDM